MAQIAQQDHLYIHVESTDDFQPEERAELFEKVKQGTILDCVIVDDENGCKSKVIAVDDSTIGNVPGYANIVFYSFMNEKIQKLDVRPVAESTGGAILK